MLKRLSLIVLVIAAAGCGSVGDLGGTLGDILGSTTEDQRSDARGTVVRVDTYNKQIELDVAYVNNLRDDRRGSVIYYDSNTVVEFQGRTYRVEDLERGDEVEVRGSNRNGRYVADRILVVRDATR